MSFSVKRVTWREWLGLGAGLLALASLFLPWATLTADAAAPDVRAAFASLPHGDVVRSAWNSDFFAWFPPFVLLLAGVAVVLFGQVKKVRTSGLPHLWLVVGLGALLLMVVGWTTLTWIFDSDQRAFLQTAGIEINAGAGRYLGLLFAVVSAVAAVLDIRAARVEARAPRPRRS
ncbi:hypothetical protein [Amycolatopsis sp. PS_44_ISF1]|uniref:hypothetical protein n=1 Tax=Amycolatopsis sp. PS_44_ISF1 TaxID=2974917 RepID=UPI0028E026F7|nr:hypothetical protein [Amycolatopsis sp. PS_44_ISF1]MDT8915675.1 hypothetical protein [Amycolatopsis sp. PS_44_ISF1]